LNLYFRGIRRARNLVNVFPKGEPAFSQREKKSKFNSSNTQKEKFYKCNNYNNGKLNNQDNNIKR